MLSTKESLGKGIFILTALLYGAVRTLRLPNDWSEAHWLISYDLGLIKRALVGSILIPFVSGLEPDMVELLIQVFSFLLVLGFVVFLLKVCWNIQSAFAVILILSPAVVMMFHLTGYFDYILVLLGGLTIYFLKRGSYSLVSVLLSLTLLIHESGVFIVFPAVFYGLFCQFSWSKQLVIFGLRVFLLPVLVFGGILVFTDKFSENDQIQSAILNRLGQFPFVESNVEYVAYSFTHSFVSYFKLRKSFLNPVFIPVVLNILGMFLILGNGKTSENRLILGLLMAFPLLLHLIAVDTGRIWIYPLLVGILMLYFNGKSPKLDGKYLELSVGLMIFLNVYYSIPLMDGLSDRISWWIRLGIAIVACTSYYLWNSRRVFQN